MNIIASILELLKIFSKVIAASKCDPLVRIEKQAMSQKLDLLKSFFQNKRSTRIGRPQLKIRNQIMAYRWTFGKDPLKLEKML